MNDRLFRYEHEIERSQLPLVLDQPSAVTIIETGHTASINKLRSLVDAVMKRNFPNKARLDVELHEEVHKCFKKLPRMLLLDMRFWQWLAIAVFQDFVWDRWFDERPGDLREIMTSAKAEHFLGKPSLAGFARNTLSRLYFAADILFTKENGYKWSRAAFMQQEKHKSIFERKFGLSREACMAVLKLTDGKRGTETQLLTRRLNHIATTLVIDAMTEQEIIQALQ